MIFAQVVTRVIREKPVAKVLTKLHRSTAAGGLLQVPYLIPYDYFLADMPALLRDRDQAPILQFHRVWTLDQRCRLQYAKDPFFFSGQPDFSQMLWSEPRSFPITYTRPGEGSFEVQYPPAIVDACEFCLPEYNHYRDQ